MNTKTAEYKSLPLENILKQINAICTIGSESLHIDDLLKDSLQMILSFFKAKTGSIHLLDSHTKELILKTSIGLKADEQKHMPHILEGKAIGLISKLKEAVLITDEEGVFKKPLAYSPLIIKDHLIGIITISNKESNQPFLPRELQTLIFLSNQIALNYQRISLSQQLAQANLETNKLKRELETQERLVSLGKLAGGIAHEFNNPLDGVMRYTNLSLGHVQEDEVLKEYLTEIQQGLKRMANIVRNLLACARNSPKTTQKVDVNKTIEQALKELYPYLASKNINLVKNLAKQLPEITDWGFERIVSNLLKNAIDAIDKSGTIEITTLVEDTFIKIQISDTGKGITTEDLERIFDPFFTTKDIDQGCGLGLTIVNEIVKYYNGKIKVKSHPNKGTTFTVKLPIKQ